MTAAQLDAVDRALIRATQAGLPIGAEPYQSVAQSLNLSEAEVLQRLRHMLTHGVIRRIGVVPNHYALGMVANGMSVWDVDDVQIDAVGEALGALPGVTHCYRRPRRLPLWPYNLFAMLHGHDRAGVHEQLQTVMRRLTQQFPGAVRNHDILFSSAILKKTGIRLKPEDSRGS